MKMANMMYKFKHELHPQVRAEITNKQNQYVSDPTANCYMNVKKLPKT